MKHWTEDDISQWVYGVKDDSSHLDVCESCQSKAAQTKNRRLAMLQATPELSPDFLAQQRRMIYSRMEKGRRPLGQRWFGYRLATSLAVVLLVAMLGFNLLRRPAYLPLSSPADERLYSDLVAIDESSEPRAIQPIQNLFEE